MVMNYCSFDTFVYSFFACHLPMCAIDVKSAAVRGND